MKAIQIKEYVKGPNDLQISSLPDPTPQSHECLISVRAAAANFFDLLQIRGKYQNQPPFPWVAGAEFAGVIESAPRDSTYKKGDKVFGSTQGAFATKVCAPEAELHPVPEGWSFEDAAGLYVTAPTSYAGLVVRAKLQPGEWCLVHAGAGGVGLAAIQIAKALGAKVIATAGTNEKLEVAKRFGADYGVDYTNKGWTEVVKNLTGGKGVDVVYDPVGLIDMSMKCIAWNGRLLVIGFAGGNIEKVALNRVLLKNVAIVGLHYGMYRFHEPEVIPTVWEGIFEMIAKGQYRGTSYADKEYVGLESVPAALVALGGRETWGKVVIKIPVEGRSSL